MSFSKREFENQQSALEGRLARVRAGVETGLRVAEEGSLDGSACDAICLNLIDALRDLRKLENEIIGQPEGPENYLADLYEPRD